VLSVANKPFILDVVMLNAVMLIAVMLWQLKFGLQPTSCNLAG